MTTVSWINTWLTDNCANCGTLTTMHATPRRNGVIDEAWNVPCCAGCIDGYEASL